MFRKLRPFARNSLGGHVMSLLGIAMLSLMVSFVLSVFYFVNRTENEAWHGRQSEAARNAAGTVSSFIQRVEDALHVVSIIEPDHLVYDADELEALLQQNAAILEIIRTDSTGHVFASAYRDRSVLANLITIPQSQWFVRAWAGNNFLGSLQISANNEPYLIMAVPSTDRGVVAARVQMNVLWDTVKNIHFGETGQVYVITQEGQIIAHTNPQEVLDHVSIGDRPEFLTIQSAKNHQWFGSFTNFNGQHVVGSTRSIDGTDWVIITELPRREAFAATESAIFVLGTEALIIMLLVSWMVSRFVWSWIVNPMERLRKGAETIGQGNLKHRISLNRADEIGQLAAAFDAMASRLQDRDARLSSQSVILDQQNRVLSALHESSLALMGRLELHEVLEAIIFQAAQLVHTSHAYLYMVDPKTGDLALEAATGVFVQVKGMHLKTGEGMAGKVFLTRKPLLVNDYSTWTGRTQQLDHLQFHAILGIPLVSTKTVAGVIGLSHTEPGRVFSQEDVELLTRFAQMASIALENARLHQLLQRELTARVEAEADVLKFRMLLDQSNDAIYVIDPETARYLDFNTEAYQSLQYTRDELRQRSVMEIATHVSDLQRWKRRAQVVSNRKDGLIFETSYRRKDGTTFPVEVSARWLQYDGRNYMLAVARDITERRRAAEELRQLNAQLEDRVRERTADLRAEISERQRIASALRDSEERYALAIRGANDGLWDWDLRTNTIYFSPRWKAMLGYKEGEIGNALDEWFKRVHVRDLPQVQSALALHLEGETAHFEIEYRILHANTSYHWMLCRGLAVRDEDGTAYRMAGSQTDITDRKQAEERLAHDAMHDMLTGLPNRTLFMDRLNQRLEHSKRHKEDLFAVLFLDLDRFKVINDSLGHAVGDKFLIATANRLRSCLRPEDTISRLGGDEFAVLLNEIENANDAVRVADRIQTQLASATMLNIVERSSTASIGITMYSTHYVSPQEMLRDADTAMYRAKALGGGRQQIFDSAMYASALATLRLEADLKRAVENLEWEIFYQPIVSLANGRITGMEALVRWRHPQRGLVSPLEFITIAEETGDILSIGEHVLRTACAQIKTWRETIQPGIWVSVNISGRQFQDQNLLTMIEQVLLETGLPPQGLHLEVTESVAMRDLEHSIKVLRALEDMQIHVSLDDFGNGYSSLGYLKSFPLKVLKIDRSFIQDIEVDKNSEAITTAIISMAHTLNLEVIAEGVEKEEQLAFLEAQFCDQVQGFLLGPPRPAEELTGVLSQDPVIEPWKRSQVFDSRTLTRLRSV